MDYEIKNNEVNNIIFFDKYPNDKEEIIRLSKDSFYYKGEKVEDKYQVYERFNEWLKNQER